MLKSKKIFLIEIIGTVIGSFFMALGISLFLLPNQLSSGGISGIATIFYYIFSLPMGFTIIIINIPLFLYSFFKVREIFFFKIIDWNSFSFFFYRYFR